MDDIEAHLEQYLNQLSSVCNRWSRWIAEQEQAAVVGDYHRMNELTDASAGLIEEIQQLHTAREELLVLAEQRGLPAQSLTEMASALPRWADVSFRERVRQAKRQIDHLRRLHLAIWVLISQCERFVSETMSLLNYGRVGTSVYIPPINADDSGGQLLDAQL